MHGLYIAFGSNFLMSKINKDSSNGIAKKIYSQIKSFEDKNINIDFFNPYSERNPKMYRIERRLPFAYLRKWKFTYEEVVKYDFIYIRKPWYMDGDLILFLKKVKRIKPNIKIIVEIPTYPYDKELLEFKSIPLVIKDKIWRKKLDLYTDRIVTYSKDDYIFNIETIQVCNAIDFDNIRRKNYIEVDLKKELNIIACSSLAYWHGYDRAICGLAKYNNNNNNKLSIKLHIVGDGEEMSKYRRLIEENNLSEYVYLYGMLSGDDLNNVYDICQVGLDSLGRHRSGIIYNSSLKGKEYTAKGLIIVSAVNTELDYDKEYKYYLKVPADDSDIDFEKVVDFIQDKLREKEIESIQKEIMEYSKSHFDYDVAMLPIIKYLFE